MAVDAQNNSTIFTNSNSSTAVIDAMTMTNGHGNMCGAIENSGILTISNSAVTNSAGRYGGAILNLDDLTISHSTISGNSTGTGGGGAVANAQNGDLTILDSTITGNSSGLYGGGLYNFVGEITVTNSTLSGNSAKYGGGIFNRSGTITMADSTATGNTADYYGGGIAGFSGSGMTIANSTIANNKADASAGAIWFAGTELSLTDSTVSGNSAATSGGIDNSSGGTPELDGSIVANNAGGDLSGTFSGTYDLIGDGSGGLSSNPSDHNILGSIASPVDPLLSPLGDYGGQTQTMALSPDSPAVDAGAAFDDVTADQRGISRPQGDAPDIGAFELPQWITYGESSVDGDTVTMGVAGRGEYDTQPAGDHGASLLLPPASQYTFTVKMDLSTWDSYVAGDDNNGYGYWDSFSISVTSQPYPDLSLTDPLDLPFVWGGVKWGDGILDTYQQDWHTITITGNPSGQNFLNIVLDTNTSVDQDARFPSWGTISIASLSNFTVADAGNPANSVTNINGTPLTLNLKADTSGNATVNFSALFIPSEAGSIFNWKVTGPSTASGTFSSGPTITNVVLTPTTTNRDFVLSVWVDSNGNGQLDSGEQSETIDLHVLS